MTPTSNKFNAKATMNKVRAAIGVYADTAAKKMEAEAKSNAKWTDRTSNAKWTDRTSNARNSIQGSFGWKGNHCVITLSGNMEYSVYLELAHERRYSILVPTIQKNAPEILKGYRKIL